MTGDTIECFNCGHVNPGWAQVCRSCGVPLRHAAARTVPSGPIPTDRDSLVSMGAVVATIVVAVLVGFLASSLYPSAPTVGVVPDETAPPPTPLPSLLPSASAPAPTPTPVPTPSPTPPLPGTIAFGTGISDGQITGATDTFTPSDFFAHVITMTEPFGVGSVGEQVVRVAQDGTETEVVAAAGNRLTVLPDATSAGVVCCRAIDLIRDPPAGLGPGMYILRVYRGDELIAQGSFTLAEG